MVNYLSQMKKKALSSSVNLQKILYNKKNNETKKACLGFYLMNLQVLILSEKLHAVTAQFDQLRAIRFQDALNKRMPRRKINKVANSSSTESSKANYSELMEPVCIQPEPLRVQQQLLDDETRALQVIMVDFFLEFFTFMSLIFLTNCLVDLFRWSYLVF